MKNAVVLTLALASAMSSAAAPQQASQSSRPFDTPTYPLRNTFVVAAETVIDTASSLDLSANTTASDAQMAQLRTAESTLSAMADNDREKEVVSATQDMIFTITACQLQARGGAETTQCRAQFAAARDRAMESIGKHRVSGTWMDGPPSRP